MVLRGSTLSIARSANNVVATVQLSADGSQATAVVPTSPR
jgi:hypothetical protein